MTSIHLLNDQKLFKEFTERAHYDAHDQFLIKLIIKFITTVIQNKKCITDENSLSTKLEKMLCYFSLHYPIEPDPSNRQFVKTSNKLAKGVYGQVYRSGTVKGVNLVTKSQFIFNEESIHEIFVNFVIINTLLLAKKTSHLVPSYGLFICPHFTIHNDKVKYYRKEVVGICEDNTHYEHTVSDKKPNVHLIQERVDGRLLSDMLSDGKLTLPQFKQIIRKVLDTMVILETSPYKLYHNDLHSNNIIVSPALEPYVIDFGFSSFEIDEINHKHIFNNNYEPEYGYSKTYRIKSGAYDVMFLLDTCRRDANSYQKHSPISEYCTSKLNLLFFDTYWQDNDVYLSEKSITTKQYYLYDVLTAVESRLTPVNRTMVHHYNMKLLLIMTYKWFRSQF
jgi:serine/threonine protein kinase